MSDLSKFDGQWTPRALSILRIITGFLFFWHGSQKLFGFPAPSQSMEGPVPTIVLVAGILEFFGGLLILLGLFTRPTAFIMSGLMAVAYFMAHGLQSFLPIQNGGELAVLYCFVFLFLSVAGGGEWSLERWLKRETNLNAALEVGR